MSIWFNSSIKRLYFKKGFRDFIFPIHFYKDSTTKFFFMKHIKTKTLYFFIFVAGGIIFFPGCKKFSWSDFDYHNGFPGNVFNNVITVTDCNLNGWVKQEKKGNTIQLVSGPSDTYFRKGSIQFSVVNISALVRIRDTSYNDVLLSDISELKFLTYTQQLSTDTIETPFIVLQIDTSGDGITDFPLLYVPRYQDGTFFGDKPPIIQKTKIHEWQSWDAINGLWWNEGIEHTDPDLGGSIQTFKNVIKRFPTARIVNDATGGGVRLTAGSPYPRWLNYTGNVDALAIGVKGKTTIYDFEQSIADAGNDKTLYKFSNKSVLLHGNGQGGVAPYTYSWSDGKTVINQQDFKVHPTQTTTYTLTVTDAKGCVGTDDVTVTVK